jgi:hypothetical protein
VDEWHDAIARRWQDCLHAHLPSGTGRVALLVWGILRCMTARCGLRPAWVWTPGRCRWCRASRPCRCCAVRMALRSMPSARPFWSPPAASCARTAGRRAWTPWS